MTTGRTDMETNDLALTSGVFASIANFESGQRMAKMLAASQLVPETYRQNLPDAVIALEMANRIGASPLAVMQNLYIVHGRPAWSSQFLISCINASGRFSPLRYRTDGDGDDYGCLAWARDRHDNEVLEGPRVTIGMAKAEGWFAKKGSKWQTMPELMLRYRAATLFARLYAPELTMGIQTQDEVIDVAPVVTEPRERVLRPVTPAETVPPPDPEPTPGQEPQKPVKKRAAAKPDHTPAPDADVPQEAVPAPQDAPCDDWAGVMRDIGASVDIRWVESFLRSRGRLGGTVPLVSADPELRREIAENADSLIEAALAYRDEERR